MFIKKITEFILFSSIFIAACAVALSIETNLLLHVPLNNISFYLLISGATIVQYNLHYLIKINAVKNSERFTWSFKNKTLHIILFITGCIFIIISLFGFRLQHYFILAVLGAIALLYSLPVLPFVKRKRIKDYGFLKIITLVLLWTLVTVWFPVSDMQIRPALYFFIFSKRFVFIFVLCLLFDIRDMDIDRQENIKTVPVVLGKEKSYFIAKLSLLLFLILSFVQYFFLPEKGVLIAMILSTLVTFFLVQLSKKINSDFFYLAGIDGMMLLQAVLVYLLSLKL